MRKICRKCKCGCGGITNYGNKYIHNHHRFDKKHSNTTKKRMSLALMGNTNPLGCKRSRATRRKMSLVQQNRSEETKRKMSLAQVGNEKGKGNKGKKRSKEVKLKISLSQIKYDPNYEYCDMWKDKEYKDDIRKDYCENVNCKGNSKRLCNHHIYLDKKRCAPDELITLCRSCHLTLH